MASSVLSLTKWFRFCLLLITSLLQVFPSNVHEHILSSCKFNAIYQLGDSISDAGNFIRKHPSSVFARLPYGQNFFNKSTGRCSNGLLMIDYIAISAELNFLDPYLNKDGLFDDGVNFAFTGATALSVEVLSSRINVSLAVTDSLSKQLDWTFSYFNTTCHFDKDCLKKNKRALFMVGEIGGNDYNYALFGGKTIEEVKPIVPEVVQAIKHAAKVSSPFSLRNIPFCTTSTHAANELSFNDLTTQTVIAYGASRLIVSGNFPIGCFPVYLTLFRTNDTSAYDKLHCLKDLNNFSVYHNHVLLQAIQELKKEHPGVIIVYGNYYDAFLWVLKNADLLGFDKTSLQKACCGIGGEYNFGFHRFCGEPGVTVCFNPDERLSWDGVHLTQRAYELMAAWLIRDIYSKLQCD